MKKNANIFLVLILFLFVNCSIVKANYYYVDGSSDTYPEVPNGYYVLGTHMISSMTAIDYEELILASGSTGTANPIRYQHLFGYWFDNVGNYEGVAPANIDGKICITHIDGKVLDDVSCATTTTPPPTTGNTFTVSFWDGINNSNAYKTVTVYENIGLLASDIPENPVKSGYKFVCWLTDVEGTSSDCYDFNTPITSNIDLYASYVAISYTIKFDANGGSSAELSSITCNVEKFNDCILPEYNVVREGYNFVGWFTANTNADTYYPANSSILNVLDNNNTITLYAVWKPVEYNITYNLNGGTFANQTLLRTTYNSENKNNIQLFLPTRPGYTFKGWKVVTKNAATIGSGEKDDNEETTTSRKPNIGEAPEDGVELNISSDYALDGAFTFTRGANEIIGDYDVMTGVLKVNLNADTITEILKESHGASAWMDYYLVGINPNFEGYEVGQIVKAEGNIINGNDESVLASITADVRNATSTTDTAIYWAVGVQVQIRDENGDWTNLLVQQPTDKQYTIADAIASKLGVDKITAADYGSKFIFKVNSYVNPVIVWRLSSDTITNQDEDSTDTYKYLKLYYDAEFSVDAYDGERNYYYTSLESALADGRTDITINGDVVIEEEITIPENVTITVTEGSSLTFKEDVYLSLDSRISGNVLYNGDCYYQYSVTDEDLTLSVQGLGDVILTAEWEEIKYIINYDGEGVDILSTTTCGYESGCILESANARAGYVFGGWKDKNGFIYTPETKLKGMLFDTSDGNVTLTAIWYEAGSKRYNINYNLVDGLFGADVFKTFDEATKNETLAEPSKVGYSFTGWVLTFDNETKVEKVSDALTNGELADIDVTATWKANKYTIKFYKGEEEIGFKECSYGEYCKFTSEDYEFNENDLNLLGWSYDKGEEGKVFFDAEMSVQNLSSENDGIVKLYAVTKEIPKNSYIVKLFLDGGILSDGSNTQYVEQGKTIKIIPPTKEGYVFKGWVDFDGNTVNLDSDNRLTITADTYLISRWVKQGDTQLFPQFPSTITVNEEFEFKVGVIPNEYEGTMVVVKGTVTKENSPITDEIEELKYCAVYTNPTTCSTYMDWNLLNGVGYFGPEFGGFPLTDTATLFKAKFKTAGTYNIKIDVVEFNGNYTDSTNIISSSEITITVNGN